MKKALIFVNGEISEAEIKKIERDSFDLVIAANGGARHALRFRYTPHYVVGDLDSLTEDLQAKLPQTDFVLRSSQDLNDLEKVLRFCQELQVSDMTLLGIAGRRLDHTLNNLSVLSRYDRTFQFTIYDAFSRIYIVRDRFSYSGPIGQRISLIPAARVEGIVTRGLGFPLKNESLRFGEREGLSNYIAANPVEIRIQSGLLFVFVIDM